MTMLMIMQVEVNNYEYANGDNDEHVKMHSLKKNKKKNKRTQVNAC